VLTADFIERNRVSAHALILSMVNPVRSARDKTVLWKVDNLL
jgi:hypothetical protein